MTSGKTVVNGSGLHIVGLHGAGLIVFWIIRLQIRLNQKLYSETYAAVQNTLNTVVGIIIGGSLFLIGLYGLLQLLGFV